MGCDAPRFEFLFFGAAVAALAFVVLNAWSQRNAPMWKRLEQRWADDVALMETSGKLPPAWSDLKSIELIGGTPETRGWLKLARSPLRVNPAGHHHMDVLIVGWEENGKRGALVQYNIEDGRTKNMIKEIGRTLILSVPPTALERWSSSDRGPTPGTSADADGERVHARAARAGHR